jgi:hypothetical protein
MVDNSPDSGAGCTVFVGKISQNGESFTSPGEAGYLPGSGRNAG